MADLFKRLLGKGLYNNRTPLEDYTTEILAEILRENPEILARFVKDVLKVQGSGFTLSTQEHHYLNDKNNIVDMVFVNDDSIVFQENKVNAKEGWEQLDRYGRTLATIEGYKNKYLRYCTKNFDTKNITGVDFAQIRWMDVYHFLQSYTGNSLVHEFLEFLRSENMAGADNFKMEDVLAMGTICSSISKMDEMLKAVGEKLAEVFSLKENYGNNGYGQITGHHRLCAGCKDICTGAYTEFVAGFSFDSCGYTGKGYPTIFVQLWRAKKGQNYLDFRNAISVKKSEYAFLDKDHEWGYHVWFEKPLSDFISSENQSQDIQMWFEENIRKLQELRLATPELDWKV